MDEHKPNAKAPSAGRNFACEHPNFEANVTINRLSDTGRFMADVTICCAYCRKPFRFLGLPIGLDMTGAAVSPDGTEGRFAIYPKGETPPGLRNDDPAGFRQIGSSE